MPTIPTHDALQGRTEHIARMQRTRLHLQRAWKALNRNDLRRAIENLGDARDSHRRAGRALNRATSSRPRGDWKPYQEEALRHLTIELDELAEHIRSAGRRPNA